MKYCLLFISIAFLVTNNATAHNYWIMASENNYPLKENQSTLISLEFSGSDKFSDPEVNRIAQTHKDDYVFGLIDDNGNKINFETEWQGDSRAIFEHHLAKNGTYLAHLNRVKDGFFWTKLKDGKWLKKSKDQLSKNELENKLHTGAYYHSVKTYFSVGKSDKWQDVAGHKLELVPISNPTNLNINNPISIKILFNNQPLKNAKVKIFYQGYYPKNHDDCYKIETTDQYGIINFIPDIKSKYLFIVNHKTELTGSVKFDFEDYIASLVIFLN